MNATQPIFDANTVEANYQNAVNLIDALSSDVDDRPIEEQVEIAAALHALAGRISQRIDPVKKSLRQAIEAEGLVTGTRHYDGLLNGRATVTIVDAGYSLGKDADIGLLKTVLGDDFAAYFEEVVSYKVRKTAPEAISKIASTDKRDLVMKHVDRKEPAPRVAFHRK